MTNSAESKQPASKHGWRPYVLEIRGELHASGPFRVGSGQQLDWRTDAPVLRGHDDKPYVPGTSIRGVLRDALQNELDLLGGTQDHLLNLFGSTPARGQESKESWMGRLAIDDALPAAPGVSEVRDHVKIDPRYGSAAHGAKFDAEVALAGPFAFRAVYEGETAYDPEIPLLLAALDRLGRGELRFGARSSCGFGQMKLNCVTHRAFDRGTSVGLAGWFKIRMQADSNGWISDLPKHTASAASNIVSSTAFNTLEFSLRLCFEGPLLVRAPIPPPPLPEASLGNYQQRETYAARGEQLADMVGVRRADSGQFYLPGSSIRGVLRHHAVRIAAISGNNDAVNTLFGPQFGDGHIPKKGRLEIGDGVCAPGVQTIYLDHVAIDRITNAASDGAKFSTSALASPCFVTKVRVHFRPNEAEAVALWAFLLRDLLELQGRLWMGASTSRGYGYLHHAAMSDTKLSLQAAWADGLKFPGTRTESAGRVYFDLGKDPAFSQLHPLWKKIEGARKGAA